MKHTENKNITQLDTYSADKTLDSIRQRKRNRFVRIRTLSILFVGLLLIGFTSMPLINNKRATTEYTKAHAQVVTELEDLEEEREQLEYEVSLLEDEEYIAKLARQELNVSKPNEILINIPEKEETKSDEDSSTEEEKLQTNDEKE
ncbi:cell division protein DivIC [Atopostipes suicloacalis DSM 15692]|uniref:Cell division protein DivIC n=1 Tax=Atopostipes suicloacalis DSM 15692 TaxID=1121025 RepID=A0A1M4V6K2_9LACT|nr:septum formation initiator family protein [Atopostipes suicloacalis]SHE64503.1 cell division protein DivIC [Atopostipes suicloacalis DSM 15692]